MSGLENLNKRLKYHGGIAEGRMQQDKLRGLRKALLYSYQAATAVLNDGRKFRCLINTDKLTGDYDNKIISIPYEDICLNPEEKKETTSKGMEVIGLKVGDVFLWEETNTHWIVYLEALEEDAYFRADIRRCDNEIEVNDKKYWVYIRGPVETSIVWNQKAQTSWNDLNYSLVMYITKDENTLDFFHRFKQLKIDGKNWQVVNCNEYYGDGIMQVYLDEYFENTVAEKVAEGEENKPAPELIDPAIPHIEGPTAVTSYEKVSYSVVGRENGTWYILHDGKEINLKKQAIKVNITINISKPGQFILIYRTEGQEDVTLPVTIKAF